MLALLGYYPDAVDGQFTEATEAAVQAFQQAAGLSDDGIVGPATWRHLLPTPSTEFTPPPAPTSPAPPVSAAADDTDTQTTTATAPEDAAPIDLPVLRIGTYGPAITRVQERLQALGLYGGPLDGVFGPQTEAAVMTFQRSRQLTADGIVGPATWRALLRP
jgi:peptidoglycan hydrolase-like protein with peptidoglycan-binding domain